MEIFGFEISRKRDELRSVEVSKAPSFVPPVEDDGTPVIQQQPGGFVSGGAYGSYIDMEGGIKNEIGLITRYREISLIPECDSAIEDIVNECITSDSQDKIVSHSCLNEVQSELSRIIPKMVCRWKDILP